MYVCSIWYAHEEMFIFIRIKITQNLLKRFGWIWNAFMHANEKTVTAMVRSNISLPKFTFENTAEQLQKISCELIANYFSNYLNILLRVHFLSYHKINRLILVFLAICWCCFFQIISLKLCLNVPQTTASDGLHFGFWDDSEITCLFIPFAFLIRLD